MKTTIEITATDKEFLAILWPFVPLKVERLDKNAFNILIENSEVDEITDILDELKLVWRLV